MSKLNIYMRAVAVTALLVVGGLGVYQGRKLMTGKKGTDAAKSDGAAKTGTDKVAGETPAEPKKSFFSFGSKPTKTEPAAEQVVAAETPKTSSSSRKFNFADMAGGSKPAASDPPPAPNLANEPPPSDNGFVASASPPANTQDFSGYAAAPVETSAAETGNALPAANDFAAGNEPAAGVDTAPLASPPQFAQDNAAVAEPPASYNPTPPAALSAAVVPVAVEAAVPLAGRSVSPLSVPTAPERAVPAARYANEIDTAPIASSAPIAPAGVPVQKHLEGVQTPSIALEKFAPPEVQVGRPAGFEIVVKNVGQVTAYDVTVVDEVPSGTRFHQASPQPSQSSGSSLVWKLGAMKPGEEKMIDLQLVPEAEGEIGSVAQVSFQAQAGARSLVTKPKLEMRLQAPQQIHAGENATVSLVIGNSGSGAATGVFLVGDVPEGFSHPAGPELEFEVGTLRPGESKQVDLVLKAERAGTFDSRIVVRGDGDVAVQDTARIEIIAPGLQVQVAGPKKRFVERQATHTISLANPGTAAARDVELVAYLPRGFKFISADHQGQYDSRQHAVLWSLEELPPGAAGNVQITTLPIEAGSQKLRVEGRSATGLTANFEQLVAVEATAELPFTVADLADPIEEGSETTYEIRIANRGAKEATNIRVQAVFPPELRPLEGDGETRATISGQQANFAPIGRLAPGSEVIVRLNAQGLRAGDHRIAVSIASDEFPSAVTREEATRVYSDQ